MPGSLSEGSIRKLFLLITDILVKQATGVVPSASCGHYPYQFLDMGAGCGVALMVSLLFGADEAGGVELLGGKKQIGEAGSRFREGGRASLSGQANDLMSVTALYNKALATEGIGPVVVKYFDGGANAVGDLDQILVSPRSVGRVVFSFNDGWTLTDKSLLFSLIGKSYLTVRLFITSKGVLPGGGFTQPESVLSALNAAVPPGSNYEWYYFDLLRVNMFGSNARKVLWFFLVGRKEQPPPPDTNSSASPEPVPSPQDEITKKARMLPARTIPAR